MNLENKVCHMGRVIAFVKTSIISFLIGKEGRN